ncbi:helix-turn-helix domain-containing protein [Halosaccharopolyspora lacisalsi]|uniref:helix-turn-helix domain-containing protein n=1 Tax=Halosaccharopolyspora lacisalsi TaxID=1000566 RepID=UPI001F3DAC55|nr:helix-turn-helix domain-containing protein [Halosaccharopolyspora lacisalsi]
MITVRTAYKFRAYPDSEQAAQLGRTFGCVRLVWNKTLDARHRRYHTEGRSTSYTETDAALSEWKRTGELAFLSEVPSVPLQQTLRHQHPAFQHFSPLGPAIPGTRAGAVVRRRATPGRHFGSATGSCSWRSR